MDYGAPVASICREKPCLINPFEPIHRRTGRRSEPSAGLKIWIKLPGPCLSGAELI
jgi:hypothetical protein